MCDLTREEVKRRLYSCLTASLIDSYDCSRMWEAWSVGTMRETDFIPVVDRLSEIVDEIMEVMYEREPPRG